MSAIQRRGVLLDGIGAELVRSANGGRRKTLSQWIASISDEIATTFTSGDATPSVLNNTQFITAGSTAITDFDDAVEGQVIFIYRGNADIAITRDATKIETLTGASLTLTATHPMVSFRSVSGVWQEVERADSVIKATGTTTARTLAARFADALNLKDFGAVGDGVTDDTVAVQAWIEACRNNAKIGFAPDGDYLCDALTFGPLVQANTPGLYGTDANTCRFIKKTNNSSPLITFNSSAATTYLVGMTIQNIGFVGGSSGPVVRSYSMVRSEFIGCEMTGGSIGVEQLGGIGMEYANCGIHGNGINLKIRKYTASIGTGYPNLTTVTGGYITNATTTNVDFDDGKRLELHGVDVEGAVTNILVGANIGSEDSVESYGVVVFGGWIEAATGTAAVSCASGLNCFYAAEVAANSATYDFSFSGGRYVLRDLTGPTSKTTSVLEGGSIGSPNYIENVKLGGALSVDQSKTLVTGSSTQTAAIDLIDKAGTDVASATTTNIGAALGGYINITGTTTITGFGTVAAGVRRTVKFTGALTLTHNGTSLILPGSASITTAANDTAQFASLGSGNWVCLWYKRASGKPIAVAFTDLTGSASVAQMGSTTYSASSIEFTLTAVNVNSANTDNAIAISLPTGFTRYCVNNFRLSGASTSLTTATFGLFTAAAGGGTAIVGSGSTMSGITTASNDTNANMQNYTINNQNTQAYSLAGTPTIYMRVQTAQGSAATVNASLIIIPLP